MKKYTLNLKNADPGTIIRTIILLLALVNQVLTALGKSVIPVSDEEVSTVISTVFTIAASVAAWWKNNSVTTQAQTADVTLAALREMETLPDEENGVG